MSKYAPIRDYLLLEQSNIAEIRLSFSEIEEIIQSRLPTSAFRRRSWWGNETNYTNRPQARAWMETDFRVASVNQKTKDAFVIFRRSQANDQ